MWASCCAVIWRQWSLFDLTIGLWDSRGQGQRLCKWGTPKKVMLKRGWTSSALSSKAKSDSWRNSYCDNRKNFKRFAPQIFADAMSIIIDSIYILPKLSIIIIERERNRFWMLFLFSSHNSCFFEQLANDHLPAMVTIFIIHLPVCFFICLMSHSFSPFFLW